MGRVQKITRSDYTNWHVPVDTSNWTCHCSDMTRTAQVAAAVEDARKTAGVSEEVLADRTGIARSTLKRRLAGFSPAFTVEELQAIANALDVPFADLLALGAA